LLGLLAAQCGHVAAGVELIEKSIQLAPGIFYFHNNLGETLKRAGRFAEAVAAFERSLALRPGDPQTMLSRAAAMGNAGDVDRSIEALQEVVARFPDIPRAAMSLGAMLERRCRYDEALAQFERAVALDPQYAKARAARGAAWLRAGDFARGWEEYEWRWQVEGFSGRPPRPDVAVWEGQALSGRRILVYAEQALGDMIQFVRYASLLAERGAIVIVECFSPLVRLFRTVEGVSLVVTPEVAPPAHELQVAMMSLPRLMGTQLETVPGRVPYLAPPADVREKWAARLAGVQGLKVGVCWAGNQSQPHRSVPLSLVAELVAAAPAGVRFVSLQKERPPGEALPEGVVDYMGEVTDLADTAGLIAQLDLVIAIDTSVGHLTGAMGKPTWLLLPKHADWRWLLDRTDSPWYPTMRLFRQADHGDWPQVMTRVATALREFTGT
jgi:Tfp pilus assembly protein PilF